MTTGPRALAVRTLTAAQHRAWIATQPSVSFLQCPSWGEVKPDWRHESLGWFDGDTLIGAGLVLYRAIPRTRFRLAYLPEGPALPWASRPAADFTSGLIRHVKERGAFAVKMGPPVIARKWDADTLKSAMADPGSRRIGDLAPSSADPAAALLAEQLRADGWQQHAVSAGFGDVQPRYVFAVPLAGRTAEQVFAGMNQLWRRNVRKAEKSGVEVVRGDYDDLAAFHDLYLTTAARDRFTPRPLAYFQRMWRAMAADDPDRLRLYLARHGGEPLAAATWVKVGDRVWYSYGASADHGRELRPSNALQWRMLTDAIDAGAAVYDLRGISDTLDETDPLFGLIRFKVGTGGEALEYVGEFDLPIRPLLYRAFTTYLRRRG